MRQPLLLRLRPFLRRDLRARLVSALMTIVVLFSLTWLGVSALTQIDSRQAHQLRVHVGLEDAWRVCGGPAAPACVYDDREQAQVDRTFAHEQHMRLAVLDELLRRIDVAMDNLDRVAQLAGDARTDPYTGLIDGDKAAIGTAILDAVVDLRPAHDVLPEQARRERLLEPLLARAMPDAAGILGREKHFRQPDMRRRLLAQVQHERALLKRVRSTAIGLAHRDAPTGLAPQLSSRTDVITALHRSANHNPTEFSERMLIAGWLTVRPPTLLGWSDSEPTLMGEDGLHQIGDAGYVEVSTALASLSRTHADELAALISTPTHPIWRGGWTEVDASSQPIVKPSVRYRSPIAAGQRWQLLGSALFLLASMVLVVVGPVVTATTTAREREAGTLPVLRMTGLSAGDLALAMTVGPNVFAIVTGAGLLVLAVPMLTFTAGLCALWTPLLVVATLAAGTHLTAIGLGDALGQRVNAMVTGALVAVALLAPGLVGAILVVGDVAATGFLLGPVPAALASGAGLSGLPFAEYGATGGSSELGSTLLGYALFSQVLLGALCLMSWRRRVEQAWAPLFRPREGVALALASVGCSALTVLDLSQRVNVQSYDHVNLITFIATGFLMPVLGWLLVSSLVRPARAAAVASVGEVRRAFMRFQAFVALTALALSGAYGIVLATTHLGGEQSEIMWATIAQGLLIAQTTVATLLWSARKRQGRHRILILGAVVVLMQAILTVGVYNLEVDHVALTQSSGMPLLIGMDASPYWLAFLVVLWAAGLGLILAALLRERDRASSDPNESGYEGEDEDKGSRWLH